MSAARKVTGTTAAGTVQAQKRCRTRGRSRPRKTIPERSAAEKAEIRADHAARLDAALEALTSAEGARKWADARRMNPGRSPANQALIAYQVGGQVILTFGEAKQLGCVPQKGHSASTWITSRTGYPRAVWTAEELHAPPELSEPAEDDLPPMPPESATEALSQLLTARYARSGRSIATLTQALIDTEIQTPKMEVAA